ncbi:cytochrome P450 [Stachybotrys elegans]|uniref:Cytochrome P450 n=1 Tax=Stachybotrys elegans TaxID=80388 RepID=A0A8K0SKA8_9HYPO|nr:cytochrome P450 [Stachybotrys elegans]
MAWFTLLSTTGALLCTVFCYAIRVTYIHRCKINELRKQGMPMPKWNWVTGHLLVLQKYLDRIPTGASVVLALSELAREEFPDTEAFLLDVWPIYPPQLVVFGPEICNQICNKYNLPKPDIASKMMRPISGGPDLVTMNGDEWKYWRSIFNPGFSTGAMADNVSHIIDSVLVFREKLVERIGKGMFSLDEFATQLTTEVILKVTLDDDSHYQRSPHILISALRRIMDWHSFWDPRIRLNPLRPLVQTYNSRIMTSYIRGVLEKHFQEAKGKNAQDAAATPKLPKSVIALALKAYSADKGADQVLQQNHLDDGFAEYATWQIRVFLLAGTDTTASMLVYVYHVLEKYPQWLHRLRQEFDEVFGPNQAETAALLKKNPSLLNNCKATVAVIKETLRLYVPAGTVRDSLPGTVVTDLHGNAYPVDYIGANVLHQALHLNSRVWPRADEFLPERFLVEPGHELYPNPDAFRPFEHGSRNCIGQTLVWNELKLAVILTCRDLEIRDAYQEFDAEVEKRMGMVSKLKRYIFGQSTITLNGERAFQTDTSGMHAANGYPCYVSWAKQGSDEDSM